MKKNTEGNQEEINQGLYVPSMEKDSCGTGLITNLSGEKNHQLVENALSMLACMEHRGACGYEPNTGDGAGILTQIPHEFFQKKCKELGYQLPEFGKYGVGMIFFPHDKNLRSQCRILFNDYVDEMGFEVIGYRKVPTDNEMLGESAIASEPRMEQVFVRPQEKTEVKTLERQLYILRKYATHNIHNTYPQSKDHFYITSFSYKTIIYKGQLTTWQLRPYFLDLHDESYKSSIALVHSRFSTNTTPKWKLAQPFRYIAHNGEINTINGNTNWWHSREQTLESELFLKEEIEKIKPICGIGHSDSGHFDNVLEFLVMNGRSLPHSLMMMIPEAWQNNSGMEDYKKAFYEFHEGIMEPWDGPASICFTDGILVGATLDRNGLRPSRYLLTKDDVLIVASEAGALPVTPENIAYKGRLQPGKILIADLDEKRIISNDELKKVICNKANYKQWLDEHKLSLDDLPDLDTSEASWDEKTLLGKQKLYGYTQDDIKFMIGPMLNGKKDPIGSMGTDIPLAILSSQSQHISNYFKQLFAQVTNPPIDPIRERAVMSLHSRLGGEGNILDNNPNHARFIHLSQPILKNDDILKIKTIVHDDYKTGIIDIVFKSDGQKGRLKAAIRHICTTAEDLVRNGINIIILSDRNGNSRMTPIPSLVAMGAVHHHLINEGLRNQSSIVVETGDARETHHFATLIGYGADAINPYMAFATIQHLNKINFSKEQRNLSSLLDIYIKAIGDGLLKIMSKIGISTLQSYKGAQIFEALGIHNDVIGLCFKGTVSRIQGISFDGIAEEVLMRKRHAYPENPKDDPSLAIGGVFQWKRKGEYHLYNPKTIHLLQVAARNDDYNAYKKYAALINEQNEKACTIRGLFDFRKGESIPLEEVEPIKDILKRFCTGAMSFGSISHEAHSTLAIAMNRIGAKSNSGEGGEDPKRFKKKENGDWERSAIKQVASGRFGVTSYYLSQAEELQIKMAQGAKPGEGGHLPGHKVDEWIARVRNATPGVSLISPPPHHDIYSIEDLAQLIFDLKNANTDADISVKLVSKAGVGIIASGVAKAHADAILISGDSGGTGASPWTSIRHAGLPWELGLAETHQTLLKNKLRDRVKIQTDGKIMTARDIAIATLLGAEEWGIATAALIVEGCIMMRKCHVNTCPVGIATQNPELRKKFNGDPQHIINFLRHIVTELREIMAMLGFRTINEMVGKVEMLKSKKDIKHWKYKQVDLRPILYKEAVDEQVGQYKKVAQDHNIDQVLDQKLIQYAQPALENGAGVRKEFKILNTDRAVGTMLSYQISKKYHAKGLPPKTIQYLFKGSAGQSFGAFAAKGLQFTLTGEANDYFGKGLSGAELIVMPEDETTFIPKDNIIIGNVALYGATSGEVYINGMAGERFAVRNSGATAVVEGVGDHGCEYMTGGTVVILGETGRNFGAGMSGGVAFIFNPNQNFEKNCNQGMVDLDPLDAEDILQLTELVHKHIRYADSSLAKSIMEDWDENLKYFIKVIPKDYKRIIEEQKMKAAGKPIKVSLQK